MDSAKKRPFSAIIFDIDNVLIDTRASYLEAIRWTVEIYLTCGKVPFFRAEKKAREPQILTPDDVDQFKLLGGFNDDWDCCYGILLYLLHLPVRNWTVEQLRRQIDVACFAKLVPTRPLKVSGIVKHFAGINKAVTIERISRMFQEIYLGKKLFLMVEKRKPVFWKKHGLIDREKLIFKPKLLEKLKELGIKLGIATGRPRFEALYALKRFGVLDFFDVITTMTEVKKAEQTAKESLRKPHPYSLIETAKKMGIQNRFLYVGDLPDDILAAHKAKPYVNIQPVGFPAFAADPKRGLEALRAAGADHLIQKPADLLKIL